MKTHEIAEFLGGDLVGDDEVEIIRAADANTAGTGEIAFQEKAELVTNASCMIVSRSFNAEIPCPFIKVDNPRLSFALIAGILHPPKNRPAQIHGSAIISKTAKIGANIFIGAFTCVGDNSEIGDGKQPGAGQPAGLRFQWASWQLAEKRSINEQEFVKPLLYNRMVELEILKKRHNALEARLKEVEGAAVTQK